MNASSHSSDSWGNFRGGGRHKNGRMDENPTDNGRANENSTDTEDNSEDSTSMKSLKAAASVIVNGGTFTIDSADDSFHSNQSMTVNGGTFEIASR